MTYVCLTTYTAGAVTSPQRGEGGFAPPMLRDGKIYFEVTWNVACRTGVMCQSACQSPNSTVGPYSYSVPFNRVITDPDVQKKVAKCKDSTCKYKVLGKFFGHSNPGGDATSQAWVNEEILSLIRSDETELEANAPTYGLCQCVEEGQTPKACDARCEWENQTRAKAINDAYLKKSLSN